MREQSARTSKARKQCRGTRGIFLAIVAVLAPPVFGADAFVPVGTRATLTVEYLYESQGSESSEGMYDPYQWRVKRTATVVANMSAQAPTELPSMQQFDAEQTANLEARAQKAESAYQQMQPMMGDIEKIMEKCGEDEACISAEVAAMGMGMAGTPELEAAQRAGQTAAEASRPGANRYQAWHSDTQSGTYSIDETVHISSTDPICMELPGGRCTRDEVRKGSGAIPLPDGVAGGAPVGFAALEVDTSKNSFIVALPVPFSPLPYRETITTDEPDGAHDMPNATGTSQKLLSFRVNDTSSGAREEPYTGTVQGRISQQSGERVINLRGGLGETGRLRVRWTFRVL